MPRADKHTNNIITVEKTGEKVKVSDILKIGGKRIIVAADSANLRYFIEEGFVEYKYKEVTDTALKNRCLSALAEKIGFFDISD